MSHRLAQEVEHLLAAGEAVILVTVAAAKGSTPRAEGTRMAVARATIFGTIGGGRLEWEAIARARDMIAKGQTSDRIEMPLGPAVGQCCGVHVVLNLNRADQAMVAGLARQEARERQDEPQVVIFGAGHVGKALIRALTPLPLRVLWSDTRTQEFPAAVGDRVQVDLSDPVEIARGAERGAAVVVMTHSHALDFAITELALGRGDLAYVGLIGSRTKRRRFERWFAARDGDPARLDRLVSPIGDLGVSDKRPEVIAALVTAEILQVLDRQGQSVAEPAAERQKEGAV
jgi:xanthine dehydrogenase accessory protein XdhC